MSAGRARARLLPSLAAPLVAVALLATPLAWPAVAPRPAHARVAVAWPVAEARAADAVDSTVAAIPDYVGYVNDHAGLLDEPTRAKLEAFLDQVQKKTGAEFAILTVPSTAPLEPSEYKVKVFEKWRIGKKGQDNGLLMLVAVAEREVRFETGYGLEGTLPDILQTRIFREQMAPRFKDGDMAGGIVAGTLACAARIAAEKQVTLEWDGRELRYDEPVRRHGGGIPFWAVLILFLVLVIMINAINRMGGGGGYGGRRYRGYGGWGGGFGGWGGGFGGGGFGGGGGGFGGFGGGMSGGGGGGGKW